ncbi:hypothetical protein J4438_03270 [Candidatus Woesearchaeota archaeon]|nr:hypothetical protein [Candidatus Woesearchaeota archaeon]
MKNTSEDNSIEDEKPSKWKQFFILIIGIFLIILILSYLLISYPLFSILGSIFESELAQDNNIVVGNITVTFQNNTYKQLQNMYYSNQSTEFAVCLLGKKETEYIITSMYTPHIIEQAFDHVKFNQCSEDTLILLHSHPFRRCIASEQDLKLLNQSRQLSNQTIIIIMCEPNRFTIYS